MTRKHSTMTYTEDDRARHYTGTVPPDRCPVCLLGMAVSHGRADIVYAVVPTTSAWVRRAQAGTLPASDRTAER